ncbi:ribose-phosphate diphosphokinase [Flavivirga amylovorans]|uniref:Ribose-phosphate diphosphokinase n=1 Tax=Flavivirga amylovorans TaxID=870486 RepID=A0ABT8WZK1_9FLAO|nr:ribose-phosphate diphosphokinase [Flavivirga amylovorans]MDO5987103.1 ribose-phosphate diphosphokinase [Flavivirga amylovorans]
MILNLDHNFRPFSDKKNIDFESFTFSGGEPHIKILTSINEDQNVTVTHRIQSFNDFGLLLLAIDALQRAGIKSIDVFIPYFPAARQDRVMVYGESLSVKVYTEILNALNLNCVTVYDPHSEVVPALLNNCKVISNHSFIEKVMQEINEDVILISPDGGALKKIYKLTSTLGGIEIIECSKSRNVKTGQISDFKVYTEGLKGKTCLIVDDICDGGGTFMGLAKELKNKNAGKLYLAVSHGIFSKGLTELSKYFDKIYSTDSFKSIENTNQFKEIELKEIINDEI